MRAEDVRVEANAGNPLRDKPSILPGRHAPVSALWATEYEVARSQPRPWDWAEHRIRTWWLGPNFDFDKTGQRT